MCRWWLAAWVLLYTPLALPAATDVPFQEVTFEPNVGQTDARAKYIARAERSTMWLTPDGVVLRTWANSQPGSPQILLRLQFEGARRTARIEGEDPLPGVSNYYLGRNPADWRTGIRHFRKVRYRNAYPGIDIVFYGNPRQLEYDLIVRAGADPARVRLAFHGCDRMEVDADGGLVIRFGDALIRSHRPNVYTKGETGETRISGRYARLGNNRAGFVLDGYDRTKTLVVDPVMTYGSFLGGGGADGVNAIAMDSQGNVYLTGSTGSPDFPVRNAAYHSMGNQKAVAFVAKMNPAASGYNSLVSSTFLGGNDFDEALGIAIDGSGNAYVAGHTLSSNFPLKNAFQTSFITAANCTDQFGNGVPCDHGFVSKLSAQGNTLLYSSYLGGSNQDAANGIAVDSAGHAYVTGQTSSTDFPTAGSAYQSAAGGAGDAFLSEVSTDGSALVNSTYFGGSGQDGGNAIFVSSGGDVYIVGSTASTGLPVTSNAFQSAENGAADAFVARFNLSAGGKSALTYCSYLGGANGTSYANAVTVDSAGKIYLTGATNSATFPVSSSAYKKNFGGASSSTGQGVGDAFVAELDPSGQGSAQLLYSTYFGGELDDQGVAVAVDTSGLITVAGRTNSAKFPVTTEAFQRTNDGPSPSDKGFLARFDPSKAGLPSLLYSTYVGGSSPADELFGLAMDSTGNSVVVAGFMSSHNAPVTSSAYQSSGPKGPSDGYVARFDFSMTGPNLTSIVNAASFVDTGLSPGLIFTLYGSGLGPATGEVYQLDAQGRVPTTLAGVQVLVNGSAAPLLYVSDRQINAVVPYALQNSLGDVVNAQVIFNGVPGNLISDFVVLTAPAIFNLGKNQGAILNQDNSVNGPNNPAAKGSVIQIFATGEGETNPPGIDGRIANDSLSKLPRPAASVSVSIGGTKTAYSYAGTAPGSFEGFFQVNAEVPMTVPSGNVAVILTVGGTPSPPLNVVVK